jgi:glycosyltransferase involved in cell wall biosynthesis
MRVVFLLPGSGYSPVGGYKVVYEYANWLAARGAEVSLIHPARLTLNAPITAYPRLVWRYGVRKLNQKWRPDRWFDLHPAVRVKWTPSLHPRYVPDADIVVATAWGTAQWAAAYPAAKGAGHYLIQHLETWSGSQERVLATWRLPLRKIVIARWLQDIAHELGEAANYVPNGLDFSAFGQDVAPADRDANRLLMLYHRHDWKGSADGLAAVARVRESIPDIRLTLFGIFERPEGLPADVEYHQKPSQALLRQLYNKAAIFIAPSWAEGWPLPPAEAMMSGCCLIATDIGGHREYALADETALLSPPRDPAALAANIERAVRERDLRLRVAESGRRHIQQFTWARAGESLFTAFAGCRAVASEPPAREFADA